MRAKYQMCLNTGINIWESSCKQYVKSTRTGLNNWPFGLFLDSFSLMSETQIGVKSMIPSPQSLYIKFLFFLTKLNTKELSSKWGGYAVFRLPTYLSIQLFLFRPEPSSSSAENPRNSDNMAGL